MHRTPNGGLLLSPRRKGTNQSYSNQKRLSDQAINTRKTMATDDKKTTPAPKSGAAEKKEVAAKKDEGQIDGSIYRQECRHTFWQHVFSPNGRQIAGFGTGFDGPARIWDVRRLSEVATFPNENDDDDADSVAFSPNNLFAAGGFNLGL
jgi:WD40 repeat protein